MILPPKRIPPLITLLVLLTSTPPPSLSLTRRHRRLPFFPRGGAATPPPPHNNNNNSHNNISNNNNNNSTKKIWGRRFRSGDKLSQCDNTASASAADDNDAADPVESYITAVEMEDNRHVVDDNNDNDNDDERRRRRRRETTRPGGSGSGSGTSVEDSDADTTTTTTADVNSSVMNLDDDDDDDDWTTGGGGGGAARTGTKLKENAVGDPDGNSSSDTGDDDDDDMFSSDDGDADDDEDEVIVAVGDNTNNDDDDDEEMHVMVADAIVDISEGSGGTGATDKQDDDVDDSLDQVLRDAFLPYLYLPPSEEMVKDARRRSHDDDVFSRKRLDRRTLYRGLLLELLGNSGGGGDSSLEGGVVNKGGNKRRYLEEGASRDLRAAMSLASQPKWRRHLSFGREEGEYLKSGIYMYGLDDEGEDGGGSGESGGGATVAMQETVAMALAHSLGCAITYLDDATLTQIRRHILQHTELTLSSPELKPANLISSLVRLANSGKFSFHYPSSGGKISTLMEKDMSVIDDPNDELAIESINLAKQSESECNNTTYSKSKSALPLLLFVRTDNTSSILKSKSAIERLVEMSRDPQSIHMLILGRNPPPVRQPAPQSPSRTPQTNPFFLPSQNAHMMGNSPPDGTNMSPFSNPSNPFSFGPNNNASGQNDPEGSRRFNIFLARTMDASGPGIMGAIAPPEAGNLFPQMFAMQNQKMEPHIPFFNASITANPSAPSQPFNPADLTPEVMQKMIQATMSNVIERLSQLAKEQDALPTPLAKAFAEVLSNDNLKKGIGENLARAAPALVDPRCQGVMLSVYVPPPQDHPNRGMMPKNGKDGGDSGGNNSGSVMGAWLNKILQNKDSDSSSTGTTSSSKKKRSKNDKDKKDDTTNAKGTDTRQKRGLTCLQLLCRHITLPTPSDPVRARGWQNWKARETGALTFRKNRRALQQQLRLWQLKILPTSQKSSSLRQMLSVKDITAEMSKVVRTAVEIEASKAQAHREAGVEMIRTDDSANANATTNSSPLHHLHPSSLITALSWACHITPSPSGSTSATSSTPVTPRRSRDDIQSLAQDKHERALVSQVVSPQDIGVTYDMIGGLHDVKELLRQSITYPLKYPQLYTEGIAREAVKGVLLFGPPGTGKTMLAKAVATEGGATFLSVDASSVENKWLGESEKNAKAVFTLARRLAPCVIFLDEVDSLLSSREGSGDDSAHGTLTSVKTTMMSEWDGLNSGTNGINGGDRVIVIGSTNRPFDLDEAVLRRFPRRILVDLPDLETRTEILEVTLAENRLSESVNLTTIAERLEGYTGSDIKEVCREAVVQISHEQARLLDAGLEMGDENSEEGNSSKPAPSLQRLRPVKMEDFDKAVGKLKKSVSEKGRELARVWEWNDEYGEIKKKDGRDKLPQLMNMFL